MITLKSMVSASVLMVLVLGYPQFSVANEATGTAILKWSKSAQDSFFNTSVGMATVVATQNRREAARCLNDWYYADRATAERRNDYIRSVIQKFPEFDPQATILAIVQKECGTLTN